MATKATKTKKSEEHNDENMRAIIQRAWKLAKDVLPDVKFAQALTLSDSLDEDHDEEDIEVVAEELRDAVNLARVLFSPADADLADVALQIFLTATVLDLEIEEMGDGLREAAVFVGETTGDAAMARDVDTVFSTYEKLFDVEIEGSDD